MAKLILSFEGRALKTVILNKERVTLGRRPDNDIQVDNLAVSGEHAVVTTILNDSVIEDLNSTNGTMVNGQLIQKHLLKNNDAIEIGKHTIKYVAEVPTAAYANFEKTIVIRRPTAANPAASTTPAQSMGNTNAMTMQPSLAPNTVGLAPVAAAPQPVKAAAVAPAVAAPAAPAVSAPAAPTAPQRIGTLHVLSGSAAGRVLDLNKSLTTLGKAGLQVAMFTRRPSGFFVTHVEGESFPLFNGAPLGEQPQQLNDNDTIEIAGIKMKFFYKS